MKDKSAPSEAWQREYQGLCSRLAHLGYISQGSVLDRSTLRPPRYGYHWTRKVAQTTVTLALTPEQFALLSQAVDNYRRLRQTLRQMEKLSRKIIFKNAPHPRRRKRLSDKVLGVN